MQLVVSISLIHPRMSATSKAAALQAIAKIATIDPFKGLGYLPLLLYALGREPEPTTQLKVRGLF
jgi:hypothetical protein